MCVEKNISKIILLKPLAIKKGIALVNLLSNGYETPVAKFKLYDCMEILSRIFFQHLNDLIVTHIQNTYLNYFALINIHMHIACSFAAEVF